MSDITTPRFRSRPFRDDKDFIRVRDLLVETFPITPRGFNWEVRRWDGWRYHHNSRQLDPDRVGQIRLWENDESRLVGVAHSEGPGDVHLETHPEFRHFIEEEMLAWAEENLASASTAGVRQLMAFAFEYDRCRRGILKKRNYEKLEDGGIFYFMRLGLNPIPKLSVPQGYILRSTRPNDRKDAVRIANLINAAFGRDKHVAEEFLVFTKHALCFRHELDLVAEAPDGSFACYVGLPFDEVNRYGIFEPVCTHPEHRQKGLAQALMYKALRRARDLGAKMVSTETGAAMKANRLYESISFTETYKLQIWRKTFAE